MSTTIAGGKPRRLAWVPPGPGHRVLRAQNHFADGLTLTPQAKGFIIKEELTLMQLFPTTLDQGQVGDCVDNATEEAVEAALKVYSQLPPDAPRPYFSRYYLYAKVRGDIGVPLTEDSGSTVLDGVLAAARHGVCLESVFPSVGDAWQTAPGADADADAANHKALRWYSLSSVDWIKACLSVGFPVIFGVQLPESFESIDVGGFMHLPQPGERFIGGHCMLIVGYRKRADGKVDFLVLNSWGPDWGAQGQFMGERINGCCWMPQEYQEMLLADEFTSIHQEMAA